MKKIAAIFLGLVIASVLAVGVLACGDSDNNNNINLGVSKQQSVEVTYDEFQTASTSNNGLVIKTIDVAPGSSFLVILGSNPSTGYSWSEQATISAPDVLQQTDHYSVASESGLAGASGKEVWKIKALKTGTCQVSMSYSRPWEGGEKGTFTFELTVTVK